MYQKNFFKRWQLLQKGFSSSSSFFFFRDKIKELIENERMGEETFGLLGFSGLKFYFANACMT